MIICGEKLPGKVGGRPALWAAEGSIWGERCADDARSTRWRIPTQESSDNSNYSDGELHPSLCVSGNRFSTTSGVLIQNVHTRYQRGTLAYHGWIENEVDVYHPECPHRIGVISARFPRYDVSLCELHEGIIYTNSIYFDAHSPTHFLSLEDISALTEPYSYYEVDDITDHL